MDPGELVDAPLEELCAEARRLRTEGHGTRITFSPKVFIPLTKLCRDVCHYCTFAQPPRRGEHAYLTIEKGEGAPRVIPLPCDRKVTLGRSRESGTLSICKIASHRLEQFCSCA